jgi:nucleoside-diphosphate-sugar epimerase
MSWCNTFDINYRILRLSNIYGPGDARASTKKNAIQHMVTQLYNNQPIQLYEGGLVSRDLLYIDDAVRAISLVLEKGEFNSVYNIGSGTHYCVMLLILLLT